MKLIFNKKNKLLFLCLYLCLQVFLISSCSTSQKGFSANIDMSGATIFRSEWVKLDPPAIYVYPSEQPLQPPTALLVPLRVMQEMDPGTGEVVGREISKILWQTWTKNEMLPVIEFAENTYPFSPKNSLKLARSKGADLLIGGVVTYYSNGGTVGTTRINLKIEIYDTYTGALIWSIGHGGLITNIATQDFIIFAAKSKLPPDPAYAIVASVGADIAKIIRYWLDFTQKQPKVDGMNQPLITPMPTDPAF